MIRPWEEQAETYSYTTRWGGNCECVKEIINDNKGMWKRGDIIKFGSGFLHSYDYKEWFLKDEDKYKYLKRDARIPKYASNQYAVLMSRYRITKNKHGSIYRDYGSYVMFITGSKIGRIKRYYTCTPFQAVAYFPFTDVITKEVKKMLIATGAMNIAKSVYLKHGNTSESRTEFVKLFQDKIYEVIDERKTNHRVV